jgi:hypothetical protein
MYSVLAEAGGGLWFDTVATWWIKLDGKDRALSKGWSQGQSFCPSTDWAQAGPIIERERIGPLWLGDGADRDWIAAAKSRCLGVNPEFAYGPTLLTAAMRCYVASKLGNEVEVPDNLLK